MWTKERVWVYCVANDVPRTPTSRLVLFLSVLNGKESRLEAFCAEHAVAADCNFEFSLLCACRCTSKLKARSDGGAAEVLCSVRC